MIAFLLGAFVGGFMLTAIVSYIVERFAYRDKEPTTRAALTIGTAFIAVALIAAWGFGDGGALDFSASLFYIPGAAAYFFLYRNRLQRAWDEENEPDTYQ